MKLFVATAVTAAALLVLDGLWLYSMAPTYRRLLGSAMVDSFRATPAVAFYLLYIFGVVVLLVMPALSSGEGYGATAARAALFGLVAYGTYALTNWATLKVASGQLAALDLAWGPCLTAAATVAAVAAARHVG